MKTSLVFAAILVICVLIGVALQPDLGNLVLAYRNWTVELPIWLAFIGVILFAIASYFILRTLRWFFTIRKRVRSKTMERRHKRSQQFTVDALSAITESKWHQAEKLFSKAIIEGHSSSVINRLGAMLAAHQLQKYDISDTHLAEIGKQGGQYGLFSELIRAYIQINKNDYQVAKKTLEALQEQNPKNRWLLELLLRTYQNLGESNQAIFTLNLMKRLDYITLDYYLKTIVQLYKTELTNLKNSEGVDAVRRAWSEIPKAAQQDSDLIATFAELIINNHNDEMLATLLEYAIGKSWDPKLVEYYGITKTHYPSKQLKIAEKWLAQHPNDPALLLCLGRLCKANQLWGKARSYLETSLNLNPTAEAYVELALLLESLGETSSAQKYFRQGLMHKA